MVLGWALAAYATPPAPLTSLRAIHALTNAEASHGLPVAFEATVTYYRDYENLLFVQDGDFAIFVNPAADATLVPGDRILVRGTTQESFRPLVLGTSITLLRHGTLPKPVTAGFDELIRVQYDCRLVTVHALVRAADITLSSAGPFHNTHLQLVTDGGHIEANVDSNDETALEDLLGAEVEVTGAESGQFDNKMQQTAVAIFVSKLADIKILKPAAIRPWSLPVTPIDQILDGYHVQDLSQRVKVHGTITYYQPGSAIVLQDGAKSLWIATQTHVPLQIGDVADVTGFPNVHDFLSTLTDGEVKDSLVQAPIAPLPATRRQLAFWDINKPIGHEFDLVSTEGQVVAEVSEAAQDEYVLSADGKVFTAIYRHPFDASQHPPMRQVALGSRVRVTGICMLVDTNAFTNRGREVPFDILLRSVNDITVVANPSWISIRNLTLVVGLLLLVVIAVSARGWILERKMRRQSATVAARNVAEANLEQRRSRILEDINGSRLLAEILEDITEMVSFRLGGARCWCEVSDGARLGNYPPAPESMRVVNEPIPARIGPPLGALFAAFESGTLSVAAESETLSVGVRLATLAIETRRLYTDLHHRSEFDLLTDNHNRFSLETHMDALIEEARQTAGTFGLIYIDFDDFKKVNDIFGHQVGDLYLQEAALRMKRQLRADDMLARLGGDEFAVLLPMVRSRAIAQEIALRLERCFDEPFSFEGCVLNGSASVGLAMYPEDGVTIDRLLSASDAAMYVGKKIKKQPGGPRPAAENAISLPNNRT